MYNQTQKPWTIAQLEALKPGQSFAFYTGNYPSDLTMCNPRGRGDKGAPTYAALLKDIFAAAKQLAEEGKIALAEIKQSRHLHGNRGAPQVVTAYTAICVS